MQNDPLAEQIRDALRERALGDRREAIWARLQSRVDEPLAGNMVRKRPRFAGQAAAVAAAVLVCGLAATAVMQHRGLPGPDPVAAVRVELPVSDVQFDAHSLSAQRAVRGFVSPDGNWLLRPRDVVSLTGETCPLPGDHPAGFYTLYGSTPQGELILMSSVNGALLAVLDPRTGRAAPFPLDAGAAAASAAEQSPQGVWAKVEENGTGAGPGLKTWVTVGNEVVPGTESTDGRTQVAWSPDGDTLAIALAHGSTLQVLLIRAGAGGADVVAEGVWPATGSVGEAASEWDPEVVWSPSGRYLAASISGLLVVYDSARGQFSRLVLPSDGRWAWGPRPGTLCVLTPEGDRTRADVLDAADPSWSPSTSFHLDGRVADVVSTGDGLVMQTSEGRLVGVDERDRQTVLAEDAQIWWYNATRRSVYFIRKTDSATLWSVALPWATRGDAP
ncbi:MAG: hypothetical protein K6T81_03730 [Alicyclobacillus macrosporangiidus]|uniref:hypothetical protein n=1 Tax=Alicyclobacillus macrosporangiidus TaxID=392015 RepID=UPI0026ED8B28|nr:hypothetical protein [Alicyclobacillus macrosporangiidus]MCL6597833.1 hypothetical protein [Alicyclobacillus macrosporangiidus]